MPKIKDHTGVWVMNMDGRPVLLPKYQAREMMLDANRKQDVTEKDKETGEDVFLKRKEYRYLTKDEIGRLKFDHAKHQHYIGPAEPEPEIVETIEVEKPIPKPKPKKKTRKSTRKKKK